MVSCKFPLFGMWELLVCNTGQHPAMEKVVLVLFRIRIGICLYSICFFCIFWKNERNNSMFGTYALLIPLIWSTRNNLTFWGYCLKLGVSFTTKAMLSPPEKKWHGFNFLKVWSHLTHSGWFGLTRFCALIIYNKKSLSCGIMCTFKIYIFFYHVINILLKMLMVMGFLKKDLAGLNISGLADSKSLWHSINLVWDALIWRDWVILSFLILSIPGGELRHNFFWLAWSRFRLWFGVCLDKWERLEMMIWLVGN